MIIFTIIVLSLAFRGCQSVILRKGQDVCFDFPYPCDSKFVTLRHSYRSPFLTLMTGIETLKLTSVQEGRFKVDIKDHGSNNCSFHLKINNVTRDDEGTYISTVYKGDGEIIVDLTTRFGLQVKKPPGKASCNEGRNMGYEWMALECEAELGESAGQIICYQDKKRMPTLINPMETNILMETILIKKTKTAFCCSAFLNNHKEPCECKDTVYHPEGSAAEVIDPCPTTAIMTTTLSSTQILGEEESLTSQNYILSTESHPSQTNKESKNITFIYYGNLSLVILHLLKEIIWYYQDYK